MCLMIFETIVYCQSAGWISVVLNLCLDNQMMRVNSINNSSIRQVFENLYIQILYILGTINNFLFVFSFFLKFF